MNNLILNYVSVTDLQKFVGRIFTLVSSPVYDAGYNQQAVSTHPTLFIF
jgi:hypothetical protein